MKRRVRAASLFVVALAVSSAAAAEEQAGGVPVRSFNELQQLLRPGERLIVRDSSGKKTDGRFVSLSGSELEITRRRWNFRTEHRTWTEGTIERIQHRDSTWNGAAIGAAAGVLSVVMLAKAPFCDLWCLPLAGIATPLGVLIGDAIDGSINSTIYESRVGGRLRVVPALGDRRAGAALSYRF